MDGQRGALGGSPVWPGGGLEAGGGWPGSPRWPSPDEWRTPCARRWRAPCRCQTAGSHTLHFHFGDRPNRALDFGYARGSYWAWGDWADGWHTLGRVGGRARYTFLG